MKRLGEWYVEGEEGVKQDGSHRMSELESYSLKEFERMGSKLHYIEKWSDAAGHLDEISATIARDLYPLQRRDQGGCTEDGAPHTITREFSCYVDYLGALFTGSAEWNKSSERFCLFLQEVFGLITPLYAQHSELVREMYRNGPVHEFDPKIVFNNDGDQCAWLESVGYSPGWQDFKTPRKIEIRHLEIVAHPERPKVYFLPVFTSQLLDDLISSIELFKKGVGDETARVLCWNKAVGILIHPVKFNKFTAPASRTKLKGQLS